MYSLIWRLLPGPIVVRASLALLLIAAVIASCFLWLFPTVAPYVPFNEQTVGGTAFDDAPSEA